MCGMSSSKQRPSSPSTRQRCHLLSISFLDAATCWSKEKQLPPLWLAQSVSLIRLIGLSRKTAITREGCKARPRPPQNGRCCFCASAAAAAALVDNLLGPGVITPEYQEPRAWREHLRAIIIPRGAAVAPVLLKAQNGITSKTCLGARPL